MSGFQSGPCARDYTILADLINCVESVNNENQPVCVLVRFTPVINAHTETETEWTDSVQLADQGHVQTNNTVEASGKTKTGSVCVKKK